MRRYTVNSLMKQQRKCRRCGCELVREAGPPNSATVQFVLLPAMGGIQGAGELQARLSAL
jgi:hypothetical protein